MPNARRWGPRGERPPPERANVAYALVLAKWSIGDNETLSKVAETVTSSASK